MKKEKIIYFDQVFPSFKKLLEIHNKDKYEIYYWYEMDKNERNDVLGDAKYFLVAAVKVPEEIIAKAPSLKLIQKTGVGFDNIDHKYAAGSGIPVCNTPGGNAAAVSELSIALILNLYRKISVLDKRMRKGEWCMWEYRPESYELSGKTHAFIGMGGIGRYAAKLSQAFGTNIIYYDKYRMDPEKEKALGFKYYSIDKLLKEADIVNLHIPLTDESRNLIGKPELDKMKSNALIINMSRGGVVNESDLYSALKDKKLAGAGIDVWNPEPPVKENPLFSLDNVIATPHVGAGTKDTLDVVLEMAFNNFNLVEEKSTPKYRVN